MSMYMIFQQIRLGRSVKLGFTNIFVNNRKLHKFATTNSNFQKNVSFRHTSSYNVHVYLFSAKSR